MSKTQDLANDMFSLAKAQEAVTATQDSMLRGFSKAAQGIDGAGKKWTMFSRILSGSSIWKLQNYIRSAGQAIDMYYTKSEKMVEAANKQAAGFSELIKSGEGANKQLKLLTSASKMHTSVTHDALLETNQEYNNMFTALKKLEGKELERGDAQRIALERTRKMYNEINIATEKTIDSEGKLLLKTMEREKFLESKGLTKRFSKELKDFAKADSSRGRTHKEITDSNIAKTIAMKQTGLDEDKLRELIQWKKNNTLLKSIARSTKKTFNSAKDNAEIYLSAAKKGLMVFTKFLLTATLIGVAVFLLKKLYDGVKDTERGMAFIENIKMVLTGLWQTVVYIAKGLYYFAALIVNWVQLIVALFSGETEKINSALDNVAKNIGNMITMLLSALGSLVFSVVGGLIGFFTSVLIPNFTNTMITGITRLVTELPTAFGMVFEAIMENVFGGVQSTAGRVAQNVGTSAALATGLSIAGAATGTSLIAGGAYLAYKERDAIAGAVGGLFGAAKGANFITSGPTPLMVGDNAGGREHVQVTPLSSPNINGPKGGNVINVHVNGRVGASDSELNDIAKKVGKLISREISRSTSTNTRF